jgi:hypothetical protein
MEFPTVELWISNTETLGFKPFDEWVGIQRKYEGSPTFTIS